MKITIIHLGIGRFELSIQNPIIIFIIAGNIARMVILEKTVEN